MKTYQHIFFDLDHTLWDFEKNSNETLWDLHQNYLDREKVPFEIFIKTFHEVNANLWHLHDNNQITAQELREERFRRIFSVFDLHDAELAEHFGEQYIAQAPRKPHLLPETANVLAYLHQKYPLYIVTNGFPEIQRIKMESSGILPYFKEIVTSAEAGCKKPDRKIFDYLVEKIGTTSSACVMIGDNLQTDILGATEAQIDTVFYNPKKIIHATKVNYEVNCLSELKNIL